MKRVTQSIFVCIVICIFSFVSGCVVVKHPPKKETKVIVVPEKKKHHKKKHHKKKYVTVCHKGKTKKIKEKDLKKHLKHGDTLGPCP